MDIYTFIVMLHVIGTVLGTGGATIAELQITRALGDKKVSPDERALLHVNYGLIRAGMAILLVSVIAMYWYFAMTGSDVLFSSEKLWIKELMFAAIFVNALALQKRWVPLWLGSSISFTSWWGATLLGLAGHLSYSFSTYLIFYIASIFIVAGFFKVLQKLSAAGYLAGRRKLIIILALLVVLLLVTYGLIRNERIAREVLETEQQSVKVTEVRTLQETVGFDYPGGSHSVLFTFTLDESDFITSVAAADIDPNNQGKIADFANNVSEIVVGKKLSEIVPLSRIGGSSLTTTAFNTAVHNLQNR